MTPALALTSIILWLQLVHHATPPIAHVMSRHPDVIEYLPAGVTEPYAPFSQRALDLAGRTPPTRSAGGWTIMRLHYFPIWQVRCAGRIVPSGAEPGTGLLRYRGSGCVIARHRLPVETLGFALCLVATALLAAQEIARRRRQVYVVPIATTLH